MNNPIMDLIQQLPKNNTAGLLQMAMSIKPTPGRPVKNRSTRDERQGLLYGLTRGATSGQTAVAPADTTQDTTPADMTRSGDIMDYVEDMKKRGIRYSRENRYKNGYGDCSTFACDLQKKVYGKTVPDTTLGMMEKGRKVDSVRPGTISIYDTGNGNRHAVTWLPNGNVIQLGTTGVKERPGNYYGNRYPLLGNYEF